jgi:hypothetical protein
MPTGAPAEFTTGNAVTDVAVISSAAEGPNPEGAGTPPPEDGTVNLVDGPHGAVRAGSGEDRSSRSATVGTLVPP